MPRYWSATWTGRAPPEDAGRRADDTETGQVATRREHQDPASSTSRGTSRPNKECRRGQDEDPEDPEMVRVVVQMEVEELDLSRD